MGLRGWFRGEGRTPGGPEESLPDVEKEEREFEILRLPDDPSVKAERQKLFQKKREEYEQRWLKMQEDDPDGYRQNPEYVATSIQRVMARDLASDREVDPDKVKAGFEESFGAEYVDKTFFRNIVPAMEDYIETGGVNVRVVKRALWGPEVKKPELAPTQVKKISDLRHKVQQKEKHRQDLIDWARDADVKTSDDGRLIRKLEEEIAGLEQEIEEIENG